MAGLRFKPADQLEIGLGLTWTDSDAGLDPFSLPAPDYTATHASAAFDFSQTNTYSDLNTSRLEADVNATYHINNTFRINAGYRYADFSDDAPYLYNTSGTLSLFSVGVGWSF